MFIYQIELVTYVDKTQPRSMLVSKHNYDLGLVEKNEVYFVGEFFGKQYDLKASVVGKKDAVFMPSIYLEKYGADAVKNGLFLRRVFIEAEDRDSVLEFSEKMREQNPELFNQE